MSISFRAMRYFLVAAECQNITRASEKLNVAPSSILAAIINIEEHFSLKLTNRKRAKGIELTETGEIISAKFRHLLDEYENVLQEGSSLRTQLTGTLRVGYSIVTAPSFLPDIIMSMAQGNKNVELKIFEDDNQPVQEGLINGAYDAVFCGAENLVPGVTYATIAKVAPVLLVSNNHSLATHDTVSVQEFADEDILLLERPWIRQHYERYFEHLGVSPNIVATVTSGEMLRSLVSAGLGCAFTYTIPFTDQSYAGYNLVAIPISPPDRVVHFSVGYLEKNPRRLVKAFIEETKHFFNSEKAKRLFPNIID